MATSHGGAVAVALQDLQHIFGERLHAVVAYGAPGASPAPCLAIAQSISARDLEECAGRVASWHRAGCATPLLLTQEEFAGSLDSFPIEYGEILETHSLVYGVNPFIGLTIRTEDLRRECETLVKGHLVHLRENYVECRGRPSDVGELVAHAAPAFVLILRRLARLDGSPTETDADLSAYAARRPGLDARVVGDLIAIAGHQPAGVDAIRIYPAYLAAVEQLWHFIDGWREQ